MPPCSSSAWSTRCPKKLIRDFASKVDQLLVVEELEPFFEDAIKAMGIPCSGKDKTGLQGELFVRKVRSSLRR